MITHQTGCLEFNQALIATPANPVNGQTTTTNENLPQRLPFEGIASGSYICNTAYSSNYNSLQTSVTKSASHGLSFQASYTFSKTLGYTYGTGPTSAFDLTFLGNDQNNARSSYGPDDFSRPHRVVFSFIYDSPTMKDGPRIVARPPLSLASVRRLRHAIGIAAYRERFRRRNRLRKLGGIHPRGMHRRKSRFGRPAHFAPESNGIPSGRLFQSGRLHRMLRRSATAPASAIAV
jgi:hypothetical protein